MFTSLGVFVEGGTTPLFCSSMFVWFVSDCLSPIALYNVTILQWYTLVKRLYRLLCLNYKIAHKLPSLGVIDIGGLGTGVKMDKKREPDLQRQAPDAK